MSNAAFDTGDTVRIKAGAFAAFIGKVREVDEHRSTINVAVTIFNKPTYIDLSFGDVEKIGFTTDTFTNLN